MLIEIGLFEVEESEVLKEFVREQKVYKLDYDDAFYFEDEEELRACFSDEEIKKLKDGIGFEEVEDLLEECEEEEEAKRYACEYLIEMVKAYESVLKLQTVGEKYAVLAYNKEEKEYKEDV